MKYDFLIVGSGLYGATFAHLAHKAGKRCLVIDRRGQAGGNVYCESVEGINVHKWGAHIFHTSDDQVWQFVNQFVSFNRFTNSPVASFEGRLYNLPFNMNTFYQMWGVKTPAEARSIIEEQRKAAGISTPRNLEEQAISLVGRDIYETLIKGYTEKQWGRPCDELPAFIIRRLPVRFIFDNNYFDDTHQGIPIGGYNKLITGLLEGVEVRCDVDFFDDRQTLERMADRIVFTGQLDEFYGYRFGPLEYRTLRFETEVLDTQNFQGNAAVNYTGADVPYTRVIEHKHFERESPAWAKEKTVITREYSDEWSEGAEPFYPVNDEKNTALYRRYAELARLEKHVIFGGRLAEYKYYDMDDVIAKCMADWQSLL